MSEMMEAGSFDHKASVMFFFLNLCVTFHVCIFGGSCKYIRYVKNDNNYCFYYKHTYPQIRRIPPKLLWKNPANFSFLVC